MDVDLLDHGAWIGVCESQEWSTSSQSGQHHDANADVTTENQAKPGWARQVERCVKRMSDDVRNDVEMGPRQETERLIIRIRALAVAGV